MRLGDLVGNSPHVCGPDTTVVEAAVAMEASDLGSLAVVEGRELVGLITEQDIRRTVAEGIDPGTMVSTIMSDEPDDPDLDVWDAAAWIAESGYRHLPVMDDEGTLLGVVSIETSSRPSSTPCRTAT